MGNAGAPPFQKRAKIRPNARSIAADIFEKVFEDGTPLDAATDQAQMLNTLEARDRAFCMAIVRASVRHAGWLNLALKAQLKRPLPKNATYAKALLITALAQKLILNVPMHAVGSETLKLAGGNQRTQHLTGLMTAILRNAEFTSDFALDNWPGWLGHGWRSAYGAAAAQEIAAASMQEPALDIMPKSHPQEWAEKLGGTLLPNGTIRVASAGSVEMLEGFHSGDWWVQDAAATIPVLMLGDIAGKTALDMCAAPGGKTAQMCAAGAIVTAVDKDKKRMARLQQNMARLGFAPTCVVNNVVRYKPEIKIQEKSGSPLAGELSSQSLIGETEGGIFPISQKENPSPYPLPQGEGRILFDAILLDAPCSATGTLRKRPDVAWHRRPAEITSLATLQGDLIDHAFTLLKDGGTLVYAVCSLEPAEGEAVIAAFLERTPTAVVMQDWAQGALTEFKTEAGYMRTFPQNWAEHGGMDGFFAVKLIKHVE